MKTEFDIFDKLYPRAIPPTSLSYRAFRFGDSELCDHIENDKLESECMHIAFPYTTYACTGSQLIGLGWSCSEMNAKIKLVVNFIFNNESQCLRS